MLFSATFLVLLPIFAQAAPPVELSARAGELKTCCFTTDNTNKPIFFTTGDGDFLDTLSWCYLNVKRDASDPNNCAKASAHISSGYCSSSEVAEAIDCPANPPTRPF
ncbi:hypothetical protein B0J12DRAFT_741725 [Macrophomina phaseolina]|uniref:Uncharacterized protein n=1 Tax=Macrophomina phaseolina TaxID=35725 RepID=A0ABQ8G748_9PEZI|nr:hypothetical protein B0J12DRAFT_741725 [Macrophomina phaseolina]